jgi:hypothetical protein
LKIKIAPNVWQSFPYFGKDGKIEYGNFKIKKWGHSYPNVR